MGMVLVYIPQQPIQTVHGYFLCRLLTHPESSTIHASYQVHHLVSRPMNREQRPSHTNEPWMDDEFGPPYEVEWGPADELANQGRLALELGEDDTILTTYYGRNSLLPGTLSPSTGPSNPQNQNPEPPVTTNSQEYGSNSNAYEEPPDSNPGNLDPDLEVSLNPSDESDAGDSNNQPVERHTYDRSAPGERHVDSGSHEPANPGPGRPHTKTGPSHQSGEHHGRENATDHGRNLGSDQSHPGQQTRPPAHQNPSTNSWDHPILKYGEEKIFKYVYDEDGRLVTERGYENDQIKFYLKNHKLYRGRDIKDCGLTLWIQRAPRTADYRGGAAGGLCLYEGCYVSKDRFIKPGDVRVAFEDSYAGTPEHNPQANAGYIHLECLEKHRTKDLREMYAMLNFKVEEREPHPNDPLLRNPTIFSTMQEILYVKKYLEQCRQEFMGDSNGRPTRKITYSGPLLAGIEKQHQNQYEEVRDVQRKILELGGSQWWYKINTAIERQYVEAGGPAQTVNLIQGQPPRINPQTTDTMPDLTWEQPQGADSNQNDFDAEDHQPGTNQEHGTNDDSIPEDPYAAGEIEQSEEEVSQDRPVSTKPLSKPKKFKNKGKDKKIEPPFKGKGKIKERMLLDDDGEEYWERFEDPFSDPEGDHSPNRRTRKPRNDNEQGKGSTADAQDVGRKNKDDGDNVEDENRREDVEDEDEDEGDHRARKRRRRRGDELQGKKPGRGRPRKTRQK